VATSIPPQPIVAPDAPLALRYALRRVYGGDPIQIYNPNANITDSSCQPKLQSAAEGERPKILDHGDPVSQSVDSGISTQPPWLSRPLSIWPLKLYFRPTKPKAHPSNTQPTLLSAADRRFIISSLIILLAFLLYTLPFSLLDISLSPKTCPVWV